MKKRKRSLAGLWILIVAAVVLECTSCLQYFFNRNTIRRETLAHAQSELRKVELEVNVHAVQFETAVKMLAMLAEKNLNSPDSMLSATRTIVSMMDNIHSADIAFVADYYKTKGKWFEACSSHEVVDGQVVVDTREIGNANHDYFQAEWFHNGLTIDSCHWCEPYYDDAGAKQLTVSCSYPVRDSKGEVVAVALVDLPLQQLKHLSEYLKIYKDSYYSIATAIGTNIVPTPDTVPGKKYYIIDEEVDATGWKLSIVIPEEVLFADLRRVGLITTILMFIGLLLLAFIIYRSAETLKKLVRSTLENERMESELEVAKTIQMAMLPKVFPPFADRLDLNVYGMVNPAKEVGGDLYDFYLRSDKLFFCIGDVSGKGVPAALIMATTRSLFRSVTAREERAEFIVTEMNNTLSSGNDQNMFITLFVGVLNMKNGKLEYCNAGHNSPVMITAAGQLKQLDVLPNLPIGISVGYNYKPQQIQMHKNEVLFLYTDGLTEAENIDHALFGEEKMMQSLQQQADKQPLFIVEKMQKDVTTFVGEAQQSDDLTMLAIRYQEPSLIMRNDIQQIPTLAEWIDTLAIPKELNMPINLALEEAVSNVMLYAYPDSYGKVMVESWRQSNKLYFTITDDGIPFDPTQREEADITLSAEKRPIGGLGIYMLRQIMDEVSYERNNNKNILTLSKQL